MTTTIKFYKSNNNGLGGGIDTSAEIATGTTNNLFPFVDRDEQAAGTDHYLLMYVKNTGAETAKLFKFRTGGIDPAKNTGSQIEWAKGKAGKNASETTIADTTHMPSGYTLDDFISDEGYLVFDDLAVNDRWGIWARWITQPDVPDTKDDTAFFKYKYTIPAGGTGSGGDTGGGGTGTGGGNPPPSNADWKIAVSGDWGCESTTDDVMSYIKDNYDFLISVGDNAYSGATCFLDRVTKYGLKDNGVWEYGNHEYEESGGITPYKNYFGHSKTYYYKKFQNVCIIGIDSNINMDPGSTQHNAVKGFLDQAKNDASVDWIFVTWHHPMFGASSKHSYNDGNTIEAFLSLLNTYKVAFVFTGHNHNLARTHKLKAGSDETHPTVTDTDSNIVNDGNGLIEVRSGTGGRDSPDGSGADGKLYSLGSQPSYVAYQSNSYTGVYTIVASDNGQTLTCYFQDIDGGTHDTITYTKT